MEKSITCAHCRRTLALGVDVVIVQHGVVGPRGFVPLDDPLYFCDEVCVKDHFSDSEVVKMPRRIP